METVVTIETRTSGIWIVVVDQKPKEAVESVRIDVDAGKVLALRMRTTDTPAGDSALYFAKLDPADVAAVYTKALP